ncbi:MAG: serine hydrolase [Gemmatimonadetes bacterium]|nr:serine hydrolase [Gemmatimonadota bacterium]
MTFLLVSLAGCDRTGSPTDTDGPQPPTATAVSISPTTLSFSSVGETRQLTATVRDQNGHTMGGATVSWASANTQVATVSSSGLVTAVGDGSATITASSGSAKASTAVTVLQVAVSIELSDTALRFWELGDTAQITATARDQNGNALTDDGMMWATSDSTIAKVSDGVVTAISPGTATIIASAGQVSAGSFVSVDIFTIRGVQVASLGGIDAAVVAYLRDNQIPGATLAVARDGRLVLARGYGMADIAAGEAMEPDHLLRYGSVSKPIVGIAAMKLIEAGAMSRNDLPFVALSYLPVLSGEIEDPRIETITLGNLLDHAGGWDSSREVDDAVWSGVWRDGLSDPAQLFRYGRGVRLDHDPGMTYAYQNYSAQAVAQYISHVTGVDYETWVRTNIFAPVGVTRAKYGSGDPAEQEPQEPVYYDENAAPEGYQPLGLIYWGASGSWIGSAIDLIRLMNGVEGLNGSTRLLQPNTVDLMVERNAATFPGAGFYYTNFWGISPEADGLTWNHSGLPNGGYAVLTRQADGTTWTLLLNRRPPGAWPNLQPAIDAITSWPDHDLLSAYR